MNEGMRSPPSEGKLFFAANPWPLAAAAQREGLPTDRFRESDAVPDGKVIIVDLDALHVDLTLRCPTCGRRADVCFDHGDDWKKR